MDGSTPGLTVLHYLHRVFSDSCPLSRCCYPTISFSVVPFSSCLQSFLASRSFQMSQLFASGSQCIGFSASASVLPMNIQDWFPLGWTGWNSLQSKGPSRVFSNTTVQKHQVFGTFFRVPWTARRSNQSILKEINPEYSLKGLMLMLKTNVQYFGPLMQRNDLF